MLDQLLSAAKGQLGDVLSGQGIGADKIDDIAGISQDAVKEGVMEQVSAGNLDGIMSLFSGKEEASTSNPIVGSMISSFAGMAAEKLGFDSEKAGGIASTVIPMVVGLIQSKMSGEGSGDTSDLLSSLGLDSGGIMDKAKDLLGGGLGNLFS
ncbi:MAG: hypothetical protein HRT74_04520 [Flavobacteriales bacterium]|nr:hypothetical protein [Flavobacteriales bacterium]